MLIVQGVGTDLYVPAEVDIWAVLTAGLVAVQTLVWMVSVVLVLNVRMLEEGLCASVFPVIKAIPTPAVSRENVTRTPTVAHSAPAKTTSVLILVPSLVARELTALCKITWPSVGVLEEPPEILSVIAEGSPEKKSALLAGLTQIARLAKTTDQCVDASRHTSGTLCKAVDTSVIPTENVDNRKLVTVKRIDVSPRAEAELVERMQTVGQSTTDLSAPVLLTSSVIPSLVVTPNAPDTVIAPPTRLASD